MSSPPPRGWTKLQAALLADVKSFDKSTLKATEEIRVTTLLGNLKLETHDDVYIKVNTLPMDHFTPNSPPNPPHPLTPSPPSLLPHPGRLVRSRGAPAPG